MRITISDDIGPPDAIYRFATEYQATSFGFPELTPASGATEGGPAGPVEWLMATSDVGGRHGNGRVRGGRPRRGPPLGGAFVRHDLRVGRVRPVAPSDDRPRLGGVLRDLRSRLCLHHLAPRLPRISGAPAHGRRGRDLCVLPPPVRVRPDPSEVGPLPSRDLRRLRLA